MNRLTLILLLSLLCSCATVIPPKVEQSNLLVTCEDLPDLNGATGADVLSTLITWGSMYRECQIRHNELVKACGQ